MFLIAESHSFCPGAEELQTFIKLLMLSVTDRAEEPKRFLALGAFGSTDTDLAETNSLLEHIDNVFRLDNI